MALVSIQPVPYFT